MLSAWLGISVDNQDQYSQKHSFCFSQKFVFERTQLLIGLTIQLGNQRLCYFKNATTYRNATTYKNATTCRKMGRKRLRMFLTLSQTILCFYMSAVQLF